MINNSLEYERRFNQYLKFIVESLNMKVDDFMRTILLENSSDTCYERLLYKWIVKLFKKGKPQDQALQLIYRTRNFVLFNTWHTFYDEPDPTKNLQDLLIMLNSNATYKKLNDEDKLLVQKKIAELTNTDLTKDVIKEVLENIDPIVEVETQEKQESKIKIYRHAFNRIHGAIKKINLKNYKKTRNP